MTIFKYSLIALALIVIGLGSYYYYDLKKSEYDLISRQADIFELVLKLHDLKNQARPIETRIIERKTNYVKIPDIIKPLKATEKTKLLHEKLGEGTHY